MIDRVPLLRRRPRPGRRFRDRVLLAMLAVALVPLVVFVGVIALDLGSIRQSTVEETNRAILDDAELAQQRQVSVLGDALQSRLAAVQALVGQLRADAAAALDPAAHPAPDRAPARQEQGRVYLDEGGSTVVAGPSGELADRTAAVTTFGGQTASLVDGMRRLQQSNPDVDALWVDDRQAFVARTVPATDVAAAVAGHRLDADSPFGALGDRLFAAAEQRASSAEDPRHPLSAAGPAFWTDSYTLLLGGEPGVTVWAWVGDGSRYRVGADVPLSRLVAQIPQAVTGQAGAWPLLVSSSGQVLGTGNDPAITRKALADLAVQGDAGSVSLADAAPPMAPLANLASSGRAGSLATEVHLGAGDRAVVASSVPSAHWALAAVVPTADLLPEQPGLVRGIESGVHRILVQAIPVALLLCVLAALLANYLSRRLVGPVRTLTAAAENLAQGRTQVPVPQQGDDEVGLLASTLERMRREVSSSREAILAAARELEGRVADRTAELRTRNEELVALNALAGSLTRSLDPEAIVEDALDTLRALLPTLATRAYLHDGSTLRAVARGEDGGAALAGELDAAAAAAVRDHDLAVRPSPSGSLLGLPLETGDGTLGALAVACSRGWALEERSRTLLRAVADQVGLALRTARLSAEGRELAVLEERTRLAREIHDTLAQQLTAIVLQLEAAEALVARDEERARSVVVAARDQARLALAEARRSVWDLRPVPLEATGLVAAVQAEARRWQQRTHVRTRVHVEGVPARLALAPATEVAVFRVVQEALANVARHSGAHTVEVRLAEDAGMLEVTVRDDGAGFETGGRRDGSFGLTGMAERARLIGGALEVQSAPGAGTEVRLRLPVSEPAAMDAAS